jgi:hypothetical protein
MVSRSSFVRTSSDTEDPVPTILMGAITALVPTIKMLSYVSYGEEKE